MEIALGLSNVAPQSLYISRLILAAISRGPSLVGLDFIFLYAKSNQCIARLPFYERVIGPSIIFTGTCD